MSVANSLVEFGKQFNFFFWLPCSRHHQRGRPSSVIPCRWNANFENQSCPFLMQPPNKGIKGSDLAAYMEKCLQIPCIHILSFVEYLSETVRLFVHKVENLTPPLLINIWVFRVSCTTFMCFTFVLHMQANSLLMCSDPDDAVVKIYGA